LCGGEPQHHRDTMLNYQHNDHHNTLIYARTQTLTHVHTHTRMHTHMRTL
jgi:hypothetical protein